MVWVHAACQMAALFVGLAAAYGGAIYYFERTRGRSPLPGTFRRPYHVAVGAIFAILLVLGYGLGAWTAYRTRGQVLTSVHALVGTVAVMLAAVVAFVGTALASREEDRLARVHRLFGGAVLVLIVVQIALGAGLLFR